MSVACRWASARYSPGSFMDIGLKGKNALVAASSKGLGFAIASALATEGANVAMGSRNKDEVESVAAQLRDQFDVRAFGYRVDLSVPQEVSDWVKKSRNDLDAFDLLVINAGAPPQGRFETFTDDHWKSGYELTLMSAVRLIREVIPDMEAKGGGSILAVTSSVVKEPLEQLLISNVFRAGVTSLIKTLATEYAQKNIRFNCIAPGWIETDRLKSLNEQLAIESDLSVDEQRELNLMLIPMGRYGDPDEIGRTSAFLLSPAASYITGETLLVDGGLVRTVW